MLTVQKAVALKNNFKRLFQLEDLEKKVANVIEKDKMSEVCTDFQIFSNSLSLFGMKGNNRILAVFSFYNHQITGCLVQAVKVSADSKKLSTAKKSLWDR